jgi:riboflavin synthase
MFTGLITACEPLLGSDAVAGGRRFRVANPYGALAAGESIAVNGVCLTVEQHDASGMTFFASPETLARTSLGALRVGRRVNLERALRASDRLGGHIVQGHVDGLGRLENVREEGGSWRLDFSLPAELARYCISKGSICLDGISLTLNGVGPMTADGRAVVWVQIIPHTWHATHLHALAPGEPVNVEVDAIAKYVERLCQPYLKP